MGRLKPSSRLLFFSAVAWPDLGALSLLSRAEEERRPAGWQPVAANASAANAAQFNGVPGHLMLAVDGSARVSPLRGFLGLQKWPGGGHSAAVGGGQSPEAADQERPRRPRARVRARIRDFWWDSRVAKWRDQEYPYPGGVEDFFGSAVGFEWALFLMAVPLWLWLHGQLSQWSSSLANHGLALGIWVLIAALYAFFLWGRLGPEAGKQWVTGFCMEFVFSMENVFIYHTVFESLRTPQKLAYFVLFIVACCQIVFQMVFFMGLASWLRSITVLPYLLGVWLIYVALRTVWEDFEEAQDFKDSLFFRAVSACFRGHMAPEYKADGSFLVHHADGRTLLTLLAPTLGCLLLVDFVMEVDVTLTKIEEFDNRYLAFTSSAAAAFMVPELFFVARDLFQRFYLLKYGIVVVLLFFGAQLLLHAVLQIPDLIAMAVLVATLCASVLLSCCLGYGRRSSSSPALSSGGCAPAAPLAPEGGDGSPQHGAAGGADDGGSAVGAGQEGQGEGESGRGDCR